VRRPVLPSRAGRERGAAAVEFALVLTLLVPLLFGIIDYGMWFSDSLAVRQGVHESVRLGVVQRSTCSTAATGLAKIACATAPQIGSLGGPSYVYVNAPQGWARGKPLVVCAMVKENGLTGVTPLPAKILRAKAEMAIEVDTPVLTATATTAGASGDTPPTGTSWSWCT
jgi:Flp pilus assembly protein TadG